MKPALVLAVALTLIPATGQSRALGHPGRAFSPSDTVLVECVLAGVGTRVVEAVLTADSTLFLPATDMTALTGARFPTAWVGLGDIRRAYPSVRTSWNARELRVLLFDDQRVLPATRAFYAVVERQAQAQLPYTVTTGGPYLTLAADGLGRQRGEAGYSWRGRVFAGMRSSTLGGRALTVSLAPSPVLFITYAGGERQPAQVVARVAKGPVWITPAWSSADRRLRADALAAIGPVSIFASTQRAWLVTLRPQPGAPNVQLGRLGGITSALISFGNFPVSPFSFPNIY